MEAKRSIACHGEQMQKDPAGAEPREGQQLAPEFHAAILPAAGGASMSDSLRCVSGETGGDRAVTDCRRCWKICLK